MFKFAQVDLKHKCVFLLLPHLPEYCENVIDEFLTLADQNYIT